MRRGSITRNNIFIQGHLFNDFLTSHKIKEIINEPNHIRDDGFQLSCIDLLCANQPSLFTWDVVPLYLDFHSKQQNLNIRVHVEMICVEMSSIYWYSVYWYIKYFSEVSTCNSEDGPWISPVIKIDIKRKIRFHSKWKRCTNSSKSLQKPYQES